MVQLNFEKQRGLIPVIVTDYQTGQVLMLAYMNQDAYEKTLSTRQMHYWSRSRQELWHKGATFDKQLLPATQVHTVVSLMIFCNERKKDAQYPISRSSRS